MSHPRTQVLFSNWCRAFRSNITLVHVFSMCVLRYGTGSGGRLSWNLIDFLSLRTEIQVTPNQLCTTTSGLFFFKLWKRNVSENVISSCCRWVHRGTTNNWKCVSTETKILQFAVFFQSLQRNVSMHTPRSSSAVFSSKYETSSIQIGAMRLWCKNKEQRRSRHMYS